MIWLLVVVDVMVVVLLGGATFDIARTHYNNALNPSVESDHICFHNLYTISIPLLPCLSTI